MALPSLALIQEEDHLHNDCAADWTSERLGAFVEILAVALKLNRALRCLRDPQSKFLEIVSLSRYLFLPLFLPLSNLAISQHDHCCTPNDFPERHLQQAD